VHALRAAGESRAKGATAYVTLGTVQPPRPHAALRQCVDRRRHVRVVAAMRDPNPQVSGQGLELLTLAGIEVQVGLLEAKRANSTSASFHA
jgi:diaminohydroxyphosphoribosylaminopyrimidine deaminase / 5-amino-6-(5-phosphoribosylamino)uracil reductase